LGIQERKEREKAARRQQILDVAKKVFLEKSFSSATIEDVAQESELSVSTIYLYFKTKDELFASMNLITLEFLYKEIQNVVNAKEVPVEKKIFLLKSALLNTYNHDPLILSNIFHIQLQQNLQMISEDLFSQIQELTHKCLKGIASIFEEGTREGKFINEHNMVLTDIVWGLFAGLVVWERTKTWLNPNKDFLESTFEIAFRVFYQGIAKDKKK
jgi:AcrR family transcriptional regulator